MKGEAAEARTAAPARDLAFAAAARDDVEAGAETEAGRGWKRGARTARAMATRLGGWPGSGWLAAVGWCRLYRRCCGRDLVPDLDIRQEHRRSHRLPCCCAAARGRGRGRALPPRPEAHGGGRPPGLTTRRWRRAAAGVGRPPGLGRRRWLIWRGFFAYIHIMWRHVKGYGPKWHNLTSSGCQISILRVRGPKWHLKTSSKAVGVFNSLNIMLTIPK